tara:strand:+ start:409 stop:1200 length:792 start_codon:yes stop_codon:yes gene_type:complete
MGTEIHNIVAERLYDKFKELSFDPAKHKYTVSGVMYPSVSGLIKEFATPFNAGPISERVAEKEGVSAKVIRARWKKIADDACDLGTRIHDFAERYTIKKYGLTTKLKFTSVTEHLKEGEELNLQEKAAMRFWDTLPSYYVPVVMELQMFSKEFKYCGTADIILMDTRDNSLVIGDYKTNKDLFKQFKNQKLQGIFSFLDDSPFGKYNLQLSFYQILLEQAGYKVSRRFIVWLKRDGFFNMYDTEDYTKELLQNFKKKQLDENW